MDTPPTSDAAVLRKLLTEVATHGAPAQRSHANVLIERLNTGADEQPLLAEATLLIDAFRNDPYLWR